MKSWFSMKPKFSDLKLESGGLDELWEMTEGTPTCPKCGSPIIVGHIKECSSGLAVVDWVCDDCGHMWSACCPFKDGCLTAVAPSEAMCSVSLCDFDGLPCEYVNSCDDVLAWRFGVVIGEVPSCSRAVFKAGKK